MIALGMQALSASLQPYLAARRAGENPATSFAAALHRQRRSARLQASRSSLATADEEDTYTPQQDFPEEAITQGESPLRQLARCAVDLSAQQ